MKKVFFLVLSFCFLGKCAYADSGIISLEKETRKITLEAREACKNPKTDKERIVCLEKKVRYLDRIVHLIG